MVCAEVGQLFHFCLQIKTLKMRPYILHVLCILYFSDFKRGVALWVMRFLAGRTKITARHRDPNEINKQFAFE